MKRIEEEKPFLHEKLHSGDLFFYSAVAGAVASLLKLLVHQFFMWLGLAQGFYLRLTAYLTHGHYRVEGIEWIFSEIADVVIGAVFGIILGYLLKITQPKLHWWLGLGYGCAIWFFTLAFGNLTKIIPAEMTSPWSLLAHLIAMVVFGEIIVLASRYWRPLRSEIGLKL